MDLAFFLVALFVSLIFFGTAYSAASSVSVTLKLFSLIVFALVYVSNAYIFVTNNCFDDSDFKTRFKCHQVIGYTMGSITIPTFAIYGLASCVYACKKHDTQETSGAVSMVLHIQNSSRVSDTQISITEVNSPQPNVVTMYSLDDPPPSYESAMQYEKFQGFNICNLKGFRSHW